MFPSNNRMVGTRNICNVDGCYPLTRLTACIYNNAMISLALAQILSLQKLLLGSLGLLLLGLRV